MQILRGPETFNTEKGKMENCGKGRVLSLYSWGGIKGHDLA